MTAQVPALAVAVDAPQPERLILAPRNCPNLAVLSPPPHLGWVPSDVRVPAARIYLPGMVTDDQEPLGYELSGQVNLGALEQRLISAFDEGPGSYGDRGGRGRPRLPADPRQVRVSRRSR